MECTLLPCPPAPPKARVACEGLSHLAWRCVRVGTAWEGLRNGTRVCANLRQIYHGRLTGDMAAARPTGPEPEIAGLARNEAAGRHLCHHTSTGGCPVASNEGRVARCAMVPFVNVRKVNPLGSHSLVADSKPVARVEGRGCSPVPGSSPGPSSDARIARRRRRTRRASGHPPHVNQVTSKGPARRVRLRGWAGTRLAAPWASEARFARL